MSESLKDIHGRSNWKLIDPQGEFLAFVGQHKCEWYIEKGLGVLVAEKTVQINFQPKASGNRNAPATYQEAREIRCVVCGKDSELTRHHVVPYRYRKYLPASLNSHNSFDVVLLCHEHHEEYEVHSQAFDNSLCQDIPGLIETTESKKEHVMAFEALNVLRNHIQYRTPEQIQEYLQTLSDWFKCSITLDMLSQLKIEKPIKGKTIHWEKVLEKYQPENFIIMWRQHFLTTMKPKFISDNWIADANKVWHNNE